MPRRTRVRRAATMTEYLVILTIVAVACLLAVLVFGRQIANLFKRSTEAIATGSVKGTTPEPGGLNTRTPYLAPNEGGHVESLTGTVVILPADQSRFDALTAGGGFTADELRQVRDAFYGLPAAYQAVAIAALKRHPGAHPGVAYYRPADNTVNFSDTVFGGLDAFNRLIADRGGTLQYTVDRILFHEMSHALQKNNPALVQGFLDQSYAAKTAKKAELQVKLDAQQALIDAAQAELDAGTITAAEFKRRRNAALAEQSRLAESYGFPSRFPGDLHSLKNDREYFAIMAETYKFERARFNSMVAAGTVTADEAKWFADHSGTFQ